MFVALDTIPKKREAEREEENKKWMKERIEKRR